MNRELEIRRPDGHVSRIPLVDDSYALGRSEANELCFPDDASLSRKHLRLECDDEHWWLTDLGAKNGTLLNGSRITGRHRLNAGDRVSAGQLVIVYVDPDASSDEVVFAPQQPLNPRDTVMTSLEGLLSGEPTSERPAPKLPGASRAVFREPVVQALIRAGRELAGARPLDELFELILQLSIEAVRAERGVLMTSEPTGLVTRAVHGDGFRISTTIRDRVMQEKSSVLVRDVGHEDALLNQLSITEQQIHSLMAVPLQTEADVIGLVYVDSRRFVREFSEDDLNLLTVLANVAAIRIDHERHLQLQRSEQRRTRDLEQAAEIQRGILPAGAPRLSGLDLAGYNSPCRTVGGDYYDFIELPSGRLAIMLGDVAGKGMSAALLMSSLQARVQLLSEESLDPAGLTRRLDRSLSKSCPQNRFVTFFAAEIDPATGRMDYCNAGHNPALVIRHAGGVERLEPTGVPLGMMPELAREGRSLQLHAGDLLAIYSDGVTETEAASSREEFGEERLAQLLRDHDGATACELVADVTRALAEWNSAPAEDDVTLIVVRRS